MVSALQTSKPRKWPGQGRAGQGCGGRRLNSEHVTDQSSFGAARFSLVSNLQERHRCMPSKENKDILYSLLQFLEFLCTIFLRAFGAFCISGRY